MLLAGLAVSGGLTLLVGYPAWQALKRLGRADSVGSGATGAIIALLAWVVGGVLAPAPWSLFLIVGVLVSGTVAGTVYGLVMGRNV